MAFPSRTLRAVCEISSGTLQISQRPPAYTHEAGALSVVVDLKNNGAAYVPDASIVAGMYLFWPDTQYMSEFVEMSIVGCTLSGSFGDALTAMPGCPLLVVQLQDTNTTNIIVAAAAPIQITKVEGSLIVTTRPPSPSEIIYVGRSPYINMNNLHWMQWDNDIRAYVDTGVLAQGPVAKVCGVSPDAMGNVPLTKADVGLGNVDNTSDANKPISTATQTALDGKVPTTRTVNGHALSENVTVSKADVGLGNVDNTSDTDKPISTATQTALDAKVPTTRKVNGHALTSDIDISAHEITADGIGDKTVTGNPLVVEDAIESTAKKVVVGLEPIQDLHGYDAPWPAGGGKNLFNLLNVSPILTVDVAEQSFTIPGGGGYNRDIFTGTVGGETAVNSDYFNKLINLPAGTYCISFTASVSTMLHVKTVDSTTGAVTELLYAISGRATAFTLSTASMITLRNDILGTVKITNLQIELGSTATSYAPYSNICPISGRTGITVTRTGVNIWDEEWEVVTPAGGTARIWSKNFIPVKPGETYYIKSRSGTRRIYYDLDKNLILRDETYKNNTTFTVPSNAYYMKFYIAPEYGSTYANDVSINFPSTDTEYHKAEANQEYQITFPSSAGTVYGGELTINQDGTGELVVDRANVEYDGSVDESWLTYDPTNYDSFCFYIVLNNKLIVAQTSICSGYNNVLNAWGFGGNGKYGVYSDHITYPSLYFTRPHEGFEKSLSAWTTWLSSNPLQVCYKIATPITYTLTATQVQLLEAYNCLFTDGNSLSLTYLGSEASNVQAEIDEFERVTNNILASIAPVETSTASASHAIGSYIMLNNQFCKVTTAIAAGATIAIGQNVIRTTLAHELLEIINS